MLHAQKKKEEKKSNRSIAILHNKRLFDICFLLGIPRAGSKVKSRDFTDKLRLQSWISNFPWLHRRSEVKEREVNTNYCP